MPPRKCGAMAQCHRSHFLSLFQSVVEVLVHHLLKVPILGIPLEVKKHSRDLLSWHPNGSLSMLLLKAGKMYHFSELRPALHLNFKCFRLIDNLDAARLDYSDLTSRIMMFKPSFSSDDTRVTAHH